MSTKPDTKRKIGPVVPEAGRPLYVSVRDTLRSAIDNGTFKPGEQMPSTKELSEQMSVSLVTAHCALQELVASGVLQRSQGKGTFIHERYQFRKDHISQCRVGLVLQRKASMSDFAHAQVLEGIRRESDRLLVDLLILRLGEDVRNECDGFLYINPLPREIEELEKQSRKQGAIVVGARASSRRIGSVDVDNVDLARQAVVHLTELGHRKLMYVGGADQLAYSRDRRSGFMQACLQHKIDPPNQWLFNAAGWRLTEEESERLVRTLKSDSRPTGIFAAGYYMALDVIQAAKQAGLRVPDDVSVVGVDDPPSAGHLCPPLTTLRQPLVQLGQAAVGALVDLIRRDDLQASARTLWAELVVRESTAKPRE
ncbi:MAG: GntR family transcriptional regulator [Tepidisphaeraceae bacterium]